MDQSKKKMIKIARDILFFGGLLFVQIIFIGILLNLVFILPDGIVLNDKYLYAGTIFITGEINGAFESVGCDNLGSVSRKAAILKKKHGDFLYFDIGNMSSANAELNRFLVSNFRSLGGSAINLTEGDIINMKNIIEENADMFISANIELPNVTKYKMKSLWLKNRQNKKKELKIFVTGISTRINIHRRSNYSADPRKEIISSLDKVYEDAKIADIKILLFNSDFSFLEEVLDKAKIKFDLAVCQSSPSSIPNKTVRLNGIPVLYPDRYGRSLASISVYNTHRRILFRIEYLKLYSNVPRDPQTDKELELMMRLKK